MIIRKLIYINDLNFQTIMLKRMQELKYNFKGFVCGQQQNTEYAHKQ